MTREDKKRLRLQICKAINSNEIEKAKQMMSALCPEIHNPRSKRWSSEEKEFLNFHIETLGNAVACKVVAKKLNRTLSAVRKMAVMLEQEKWKGVTK